MAIGRKKIVDWNKDKTWDKKSMKFNEEENWETDK